MPPDDKVRIRHMIEMAEAAMEITAGRSASDIANDLTLRLALTRALEVLGEAASRTSAETRTGAPEIAWPLMVGMRNRLVHAYFDVDPDILWKTATVSIPELLPRLRALLDRL